MEFTEQDILDGKAVKCLECGAIETRLQWTHFKYKCTGRFERGVEYKKAYPGALLVAPNVASKTSMTLENQIKKYGKDEGERKWKEYCEKQRVSNLFETKVEKFGWSKEEFDTFNKSRAVTFDNLLNKYGPEEAQHRWNEYCQKQTTNGNTLDYFIEKYGKLEGPLKYNRVNFLKGQSLESCIYRYGKENGHKKYLENIEKFSKRSSKSKQQMDLFQEVLRSFSDIKYYGYDKKEFGLYDSDNSRYFFYDLVFSDYKLCIEYNGDYWHANPDLYEEDHVMQYPNREFKLVRDVWNYDNSKLNLIKSKGYQTLVIWEKDFLSNKNETVEKCKQWVKMNISS